MGAWVRGCVRACVRACVGAWVCGSEEKSLKRGACKSLTYRKILKVLRREILDFKKNPRAKVSAVCMSTTTLGGCHVRRYYGSDRPVYDYLRVPEYWSPESISICQQTCSPGSGADRRPPFTWLARQRSRQSETDPRQFVRILGTLDDSAGDTFSEPNVPTSECTQTIFLVKLFFLQRKIIICFVKKISNRISLASVLRVDIWRRAEG